MHSDETAFFVETINLKTFTIGMLFLFLGILAIYQYCNITKSEKSSMAFYNQNKLER